MRNRCFTLFVMGFLCYYSKAQEAKHDSIQQYFFKDNVVSI